MTEKIKWQPDDAQREILESLLAEAKKEETLVAFAKKFLPFGDSRFAQIMDALDPEVKFSYFDKISESTRVKQMDQLKQILDDIPGQRRIQSQITETDIFETSKVKALDKAVSEAGNKPGPERIIMHLGPTGSGKTMVCNYLAKHKNARFVEVRDVWRISKSGFVPLKDICAGVGCRVSGNFLADMQDALIKYCEGRKMIICFDEGEHFGATSLTLLKLLCNKTRIVPVVCISPRMYEKWFNWFPNEAEQIARRTHCIIDSTIIKSDDAALFFEKDQFDDPKKAIEVITREAMTFGHFSLIARVAKELAGVTRAKLGADGDVVKAIEAAQRQMRRAK